MTTASAASFNEVESVATIERSAVTEITGPSPPMTSMLPKGLSIQTEPPWSIVNSRTMRLTGANVVASSCVAGNSAATAMRIRMPGFIGVECCSVPLPLSRGRRCFRRPATLSAQRVERVGVEHRAAAASLASASTALMRTAGLGSFLSASTSASRCRGCGRRRCSVLQRVDGLDAHALVLVVAKHVRQRLAISGSALPGREYVCAHPVDGARARRRACCLRSPARSAAGAPCSCRSGAR